MVGVHVDTITKVVFFFKKTYYNPPKIQISENYLSVLLFFFLFACFFLPETCYHKSQATSLQTPTHYEAKDGLELLISLASLSRVSTTGLPSPHSVHAELVIDHEVPHTKGVLHHLRYILTLIFVKLNNILKSKF